MTSRVPPSMRDLPEKRTARWLQSTFPGAGSGRVANADPLRAVPGPVEASEDGAGSGTDTSQDSVQFHNQDIFDDELVDGVQDLELTYLPIPGSVHCELNGIKGRRGVDWEVEDATITCFAAWDVRDEDVVTVEYAYLEGMPTVPDDPLPLNIPFQADGWSYAGTTSPAVRTTQLDPDTDFSSWDVGQAPLGWNSYTDVDGHAKNTSLPLVNSGELGHEYDAVVRRLMPPGTDIVVTVDETNYCDVFADTTLIASSSTGGALKLTSDPFDKTEQWHLIIRITSGAGLTNGGVDIQVEGFET